MYTKPWYQSKTLWFAVLWGIVQLAGIFGFFDYSPSEDVTELVALVVAVVVFGLRVLTNKGLRL